MSIGTLITVVEGGTWLARKTYEFGYWMLYGTPKTKEEENAEKLQKIEQDLAQINENTRRSAAVEEQRLKEQRLLSPSMFITPDGVYPAAQGPPY